MPSKKSRANQALGKRRSGPLGCGAANRKKGSRAVRTCLLIAHTLERSSEASSTGI
jgi:hypothetical protein